MDLKTLIASADSMPSYPVSEWHPQHKASIDISIHKDGSWWHEGSVFERHKLVQLFSRLLAWRDGRYWLVTPAEQLAIEVEDLPFIVVAADLIDDTWQLTTNCGDSVSLVNLGQLRVDTSQVGAIPQVHVRDGLWANLSRQAYFDMAMQVQEQQLDGKLMGYLHSAGVSFPFGLLEA